ncbi:hypothetical protein, partial [Acetobacter indonesiensis]
TVKESDSLTKQLINDAIQAQVFSVEPVGSENGEPVSGSANSQVDASSSLKVAGNDTQNPAGVTTQVYKRGSPEDPYANYTANPGYGSSDNSDSEAGAHYTFKENVYGNGADETVQAVNGKKPKQDLTESPALQDSPYNPDVVNNRVKPPYQSNPAHDIGTPLYNPRKSPEPSDAQSVYENSAIRGAKTETSQKAWYGKGEQGYYRFFSDNAGTVHFSGIVKPSEVPSATKNTVDGMK